MMSSGRKKTVNVFFDLIYLTDFFIEKKSLIPNPFTFFGSLI